jgi:hypothetical protein
MLQEIEDMPHERGFDPEVAARYGVFDRQAGFVKHAEVYLRKKKRADAVKRQLAESPTVGTPALGA